MRGLLCSLVRGALAKVSEGPVGPREAAPTNDEDMSSLPAPLPPSHYRRVGEEGENGANPGDLGVGTTF